MHPGLRPPVFYRVIGAPASTRIFAAMVFAPQSPYSGRQTAAKSRDLRRCPAGCNGDCIRVILVWTGKPREENRLDNQYKILGVDESASIAEIKRAFREKAKQHHPDIAGEGMREYMQKLLDAYEILSNRQRRFDYDRVRRGAGKQGFNYRDYLYEQAEIYKAGPRIKKSCGASKIRENAQAELIIFELLHFEEDAAIKIWHDLGGVDFPLRKHLGREDWMDCSFILAEELEKRGCYYEAFQLLIALMREERRLPYFRHFAEDVEIFLKEIVRLRLRRDVDDETWIECMQDLLGLGFSAREESRWLKSQAEALAGIGETSAALAVFRAAQKRDPAVTASAKLKKLCKAAF
jgi:hypothetical protein